MALAWLTCFPPLLSIGRDRWGAITAYLQVVLGAIFRARAGDGQQTIDFRAAIRA